MDRPKRDMTVPNTTRYEVAAAKTKMVMVKRLRWLSDADLAALIEAAQFEALIRAQGRTTDEDAGGGV